MAFLKFDEIFDLASTFTTHVSRSCIVDELGGVTGAVKLSAFNPGTLRALVDIPIPPRAFPPRTRKPGGIIVQRTPRGRIPGRDGSTLWAPRQEWGLLDEGYVTTLESLQSNISQSIYDSGKTNYFATNNLGDPDIEGNLFSDAHRLPELARDNKYFCTTRFEPDWLVTSSIDGSTYDLTIDGSGSARKNFIRKNLYEQYRGIYRQCNWAYTNYNTLNFFTSSVTRNDVALIYPSPTSSVDSSARYRPDGPFTFEFWINPRYTIDGENDEFNAGTILHYSSAYAISLVSGSSRDISGLTDGYRLILQLSSSADLNPSQVPIDSTLPILYGGVSGSLVYSSSDNSLSKNNWHHVAIRWGGSQFNNFTGSFVIDGVVDTEFVIPSSSTSYSSPSTSYLGYDFNIKSDADALFIGNYYEGDNTNTTTVRRFFNTTVGTNEGLEVIESEYPQDPITFSFNNKLNAEIHEIKLYKGFRDLLTIKNELSSGLGGNSLEVTSSEGLSLYIPPFFTRESPTRLSLSTNINTFEPAQMTTTPFNASASFGSTALDINVENFVRDFANNVYPRVYNLTASGGDLPVGNVTHTAKQQMMSSQKSNARNFLILPNDNGLFTPQYFLLNSGTLSQIPITGSENSRYVNDYGVLDFSLISLNRMLDGRKSFFEGDVVSNNNLYEPAHNFDAFEGPVTTVGGIEGAIYGDDLEINPMWLMGYFPSMEALPTVGNNSPAYPRNAAVTSADGNKFLYMFELYGDESSNEVVFFNIPQIMYGNRIEPGTFVLKDTAMTGTDGKVSVTLKDDGFGSLYRADSLTQHAVNASVGNLFYDFGIAAIKTPHLPYFGSGSYSMSFKGSQNTHVREIIAIAPKNTVNSSSNPTYVKMLPSDSPNEVSSEFVYITTILLHDENLNVIGRANLSQPLKKRITDEFAFKLKMDY